MMIVLFVNNRKFEYLFKDEWFIKYYNFIEFYVDKMIIKFLRYFIMYYFILLIE